MGPVRPGAQGAWGLCSQRHSGPQTTPRMRQDEEARAAGTPASGPGGHQKARAGTRGTAGEEASHSGGKAPVCAAAHCMEQCLAHSKCLLSGSTRMTGVRGRHKPFGLATC